MSQRRTRSTWPVARHNSRLLTPSSGEWDRGVRKLFGCFVTNSIQFQDMSGFLLYEFSQIRLGPNFHVKEAEWFLHNDVACKLVSARKSVAIRNGGENTRCTANSTYWVMCACVGMVQMQFAAIHNAAWNSKLHPHVAHVHGQTRAPEFGVLTWASDFVKSALRYDFCSCPCVLSANAVAHIYIHLYFAHYRRRIVLLSINN